MVLFRRYCPLVLRGLVYLDWVLFLDLWFWEEWLDWMALSCPLLWRYPLDYMIDRLLGELIPSQRFIVVSVDS